MPSNNFSEAMDAAITSIAAANAANTVGTLCEDSMGDCRSRSFTDDRDCPGGCNGEAIAILEPVSGSELAMERCCDANGCCGLYPSCCRNPFWPSFAHPTWLCCRDLYRQR